MTSWGSPDALAARYAEWFASEVITEVLSNTTLLLTVPMLNHYNDHLQVYAEFDQNDRVRLTDDGTTFGELEDSGVEMTGSREEIISVILKRHGVEQEGNDLVVYVSPTDVLGYRVHSLLQAMLAVDTMFMKVAPDADWGLMITWFANAIEQGRMSGAAVPSPLTPNETDQ